MIIQRAPYQGMLLMLVLQFAVAVPAAADAASFLERHPGVFPCGIVAVAALILLTIVLLMVVVRQRRLQNQLAASERNYRLLADQATDVIWTMDIHHHYTYISPSVERLLGYSPQEILAMPLEKRFTPESFATAQRLIAERQQHWRAGIPDDRSNRMELEQIRKDGSTVWTEIVSNPLLNEQGQPLGIVGVTRDITERKQAEEALRASEERFRTMAENSPDVIARFDHGGRHLYVNSAISHYVDLRPQDYLGKTNRELEMPEERIRQWDHYIQTTFETGSIQEYEFEFEGLQGLSVFNCRLSPEYDQKGRVKSVISVARDVSERRRAQEALQESRANLLAVLENVYGSIWSVDRNYQLIVGNATFRHECRTGLGHEIAPGESVLLDVLPQAQYDEWQGYYDRALHGEHFSFERLRRYSLQPHWTEYHFGPIRTPDGRITGATVFAHNVTERKHAEQALHASEARLREANAVKDTFFSIIAHDLKAPMVGFISGARMLRERVQSSADELTLTLAKELDSSAQKVYKLLENLLTWSQMQQGKIPYKPMKLDVALRAESCLRLLRENAEQKQITLTNLIEKAVFVHADGDMLDAIFRNLISNAIKFTRPGGTVTMTAQKRAEMVEIVVSDSGVGMPADKVQRLFRVGERKISTSGTDGENGTGLGLILCKEFVECHGGEIRCESEQDCGSTFRFTLPGAREPGDDRRYHDGVSIQP